MFLHFPSVLLVPMQACLLTVAVVNLRADVDEEIKGLRKQMTELNEQRKPFEALTIAERVVALAEQSYGPEHTNVAESLSDLGKLHVNVTVSEGKQEHLEKAEQLHRRALVIYENAFGPKSEVVAANLFNLGRALLLQEKLTNAATVLQRATEINAIAVDPLDGQTVRTLWLLALTYSRQGLYPQAETNWLRALHLIEQSKQVGPDFDAAETLNSLGFLYTEWGRYDEAELMLRQGIARLEKNDGTNRPLMAITLGNLALVYHHAGRISEAEAMYQRVLSIKQGARVRNEQSIARTLNNLAMLYNGISDDANAEKLLMRSLELGEKAFGPEHTWTATAIDNLAVFYADKRDFEKAEALKRRSLAIREKILGSDHPSLLVTLNNLAEHFVSRRDYSAAEPFYQRALTIGLARLGKDHPSVAGVQMNLGKLYRKMNENARAEQLLTEALSILRSKVASNHQLVLQCLHQLVRIKNESGRAPEAVNLALDAWRIEEQRLAEVLSFGSERQRLAFLSNGIDPYSDLATLGSARALAVALLHHKGVVLDSLLEDRRLAESATDAHSLELVKLLRGAKHRLSGLLFSEELGTDPKESRARQLEIDNLKQQSEQYESALARHFSSLGHARRALSVALEDVQSRIPERTILVDYVGYEHFLPGDKSERRFGAVVVSRTGEPRWVPLTTESDIAGNIKRYKNAMQPGGGAALPELLRELHRLLWAPIESVLPPEIRTIIVCPEGELNFVSFATMLNASNQFLGEKYLVEYVSSGRDLLGEPMPRPLSRDLVILANPDFGSGLTTETTNRLALTDARSTTWRTFRDWRFQPLPGAEKEGQQLKAQYAQLGFSSVLLRLGKDASEAELRRLDSPYVLHLATHGFFLLELENGEQRPASPDEGRSRFSRAGIKDNPMLRSGLALAGAQRTVDGWPKGEFFPAASDGIVTAEEIATLKLHDTWLVVLSACDTASGMAAGREGVLGLRRGFIQTGARNLVMALWSIDDQVTAAFMIDFYGAVSKSGNPPEALAEVQRQWLTRLKKERGVAKACQLAGPFILSFQGFGPRPGI